MAAADAVPQGRRRRIVLNPLAIADDREFEAWLEERLDAGALTLAAALDLALRRDARGSSPGASCPPAGLALALT